MQLTEGPLPDGDCHEFLWRGVVVGVLRWAGGTGDIAAGWWLEPTTGETRLVWRSAGDADLARDRIEHERAARWLAQTLLVSNGVHEPARASANGQHPSA